ncbi:hypothetical protein LTR85_005961 [Meristemomyces frigidus]|nr:hypothetical protein LTR85_005961 [Meristemomyces frigidus]
MVDHLHDIDTPYAFLQEAADFLLSKLDIYPHGACGPRRDAPIDCFKPVHQAYKPEAPHQRNNNTALTNVMAYTVPGSVSRAVGDGVVYDRDVEQSFATALALESVYLAVEEFLDCDPGVRELDATTLLARFRDYLGRLDTQTLTITHSSLVADMLVEYRARVAMGLQPFSSHDRIADFIMEFVHTRDCFFYADGCMPVVKATFSTPIGRRDGNMRAHVHFEQSQPRMLFDRLCNVVNEGEQWTLQPMVEMDYATSLTTTAECFISPIEEQWLHYDEDDGCFH